MLYLKMVFLHLHKTTNAKIKKDAPVVIIKQHIVNLQIDKLKSII